MIVTPSTVTPEERRRREALLRPLGWPLVYSTVVLNAVTYFARGVLPGVTVTNDATWLTGPNAQVGTGDETDARLRLRNVSGPTAPSSIAARSSA